MRYPVMNLARGYRMGQGPSASFSTLKDTAKAFKDAIDSNAPGSGADADNLAAQFNNQMNQAIQNGESPTILYDDLEKAGIPPAYLNNMRPEKFVDPFTNTWYGTPSLKPTGTNLPGQQTGGGANNPYQPQGVKANQNPQTATEGGVSKNPPPPPPPSETAAKPSFTNEEGGGYEGAGGPGGFPGGTATPAPMSTGGAHSYEEEAAQYQQQLKEFQDAAKKAQEEADAQIKASNEAREKAMKEMKEKYESGNPNAVCGPGEFWDGHQCRGSVQGGRSGLISQAMNLGPSGASLPAGNVAFGGEGFSSGGAPGEFSMVGRLRPNMGRRSFPVVNL